ncbi:MAG: pantoate--beta-alanine ligase [Elusimicrobiota bacterium]
MKIIRTVQKMQSVAMSLKLKGRSIGVVPTMGALHGAHLSIIRRARQEVDTVIVTIFVNPKQFGPKEDFLKYPRPFNKDVSACRRMKVDYVFAPAVSGLYKSGHLTCVNVEKLSGILCGKYRPGYHFRGVATVVAKLFNITMPDRAYFGQKDYQQLKIIEKMTDDLHFPVKIVRCKTVRERDGLAMSSRNFYLDRTHRIHAGKIYRALKNAGKEILSKRVRRVSEIKKGIMGIISTIPGARIEYVEIVEPETLVPYKKNIKIPAQVLVAVWVGRAVGQVGRARLIDNIRV